MSSIVSKLFADSDGALFIGFICSCALYGWYMSQVWTYYRQYRQDSIGVQIGVAVLTALETANVVASAHGFYHTLIIAFGKPSPSVPLSFYLYYLITPITVVMVQLFFIYRLYLLLDRRNINRVLFAFTAALGIASSVLNIEVIADEIHHNATSTKIAFGLDRFRSIGALASGLCVVCDALITWSLCRGLAASRNGFASTERTIQGITTYVLNRGIVLLIVQLAALVGYLVHSHVNAFLFFPPVLSKLYANSLVSFLVSFEPRRLGLRAPSPDAFGVSAGGVEEAHHNIRLGVLQTTDVEVGYDGRIRDSIVSQAKFSPKI